MAEVKRFCCSKEQYLQVAVPVLKEFGVAFKDGNRVTQSKQKYWELIRLVSALNIAVTASAGANVSLSGVGVYRFSEAGRTEESRSLRFKSKLSSTTSRVLKEHQELIKEPNILGDSSYDEKKFLADVHDCLDALGTPVAASTAEVVECNDEGLI